MKLRPQNKPENKNFIEIDLNSSEIEEGRFMKMIKAVLQFQDQPEVFKTPNEAKGGLGESLCHILLPELFSNIYFIQGQVGKEIITNNEESAYNSAKEFFSQPKYSSYEFAVTQRDFSGGQPYSLDMTYMMITRKDVENWLLKKQSTATYFVFEAKTNSSKLSESQSQFSYVKKQATHMFMNRNKIEDRSQLGQDILIALNENRVLYCASWLDLQSGKMTGQFIQ